MKLIEMNLTNRRGSLSSWPFFFPFVVRIRSYSRAKAELSSFSSSVSGFTRLNLFLYKAEKKKKKHQKKEKEENRQLRSSETKVNESGRVKTGVSKFLRGSHARDVTSRE